MPSTPLKPEDMNQFAGQFTEAESPIFNMLPKDSTVVVGGDYRKRDSDYEKPCFICAGTVFLDERDRAALANEKKLCILCPTCYFKLEPKEVK